MDKYEIRRLKLIELCDKRYGGKLTRLALAIGKDASYVSRMMYPDGKSGKKRIGEDMRDHIESACGAYGWLDNEPENFTGAPDIRGFVPLINWVQAGDFSEVLDHLSPTDELEYVPLTVTKMRHTFALTVQGDSMSPDFPPGMRLIVEPDLQYQAGDYVIAKNGEEATFKQLVRDGGEWYLKPINPHYPLKPLGTAKIIGVVREAVRKFR